MQHLTKSARTAMLWRIHWWAALVSTPFALIATLTGILYIFTPQVETALYGHLERVAPVAHARPLDELVAAAQHRAPAGTSLHSVIVPVQADESVKATFAPQEGTPEGHQHHGGGHAPSAAPRKPSFGLPSGAVTVFVDPANASVLGELANTDRFGSWAKRLHSRLLQGEGWRWMIELAASWLMVMLVTGVALWLPGALPRRGRTGRAAWRQWHAFLGVALGVVSLAILLTGITWSKYAGEQVRALRDATGQTNAPMPRGLASVPVQGLSPMSWQAALERARAVAPSVALQLMPPDGQRGTWRASVADRSQPAMRLNLVLDAYSGAVLYQSGWDQLTLFGKATGVGIPFHRGEFGWWNQAVLLVFGLGILFSLVSGWVMYFKRKKQGALTLPVVPRSAWRAFGPLWWATGAALSWLMPLLAISAPGVLLADRLLSRPVKG